MSRPVVAIVGAGDLGGVLASALAGRNRVGDVRLAEEAGTAAAGKALDIQQSTPVHGSAVRVTGHGALEAVAGADVVVLADAFGPPPGNWQGEAGLMLVRRLAALAPAAPLVLAGSTHAWLVERAAAELGVPWTRVLGSAPSALRAAVQALVGVEIGASPLDVNVAITGLPPGHLVVAWECATIAGAPAVSRVDRPARLRIDRRLPLLWPPGPVALAAAAAVIVEALCAGSHRPHDAFLALEAPASRTRRAVVASAYVGPGGVTRAALPDLSTQERLALDHVLTR